MSIWFTEFGKTVHTYEKKKSPTIGRRWPALLLLNGLVPDQNLIVVGFAECTH